MKTAVRRRAAGAQHRQQDVVATCGPAPAGAGRELRAACIEQVREEPQEFAHDKAVEHFVVRAIGDAVVERRRALRGDVGAAPLGARERRVVDRAEDALQRSGP